MATSPGIKIRPLTIVLIVVAVLFVILAAVYFTTAANKLPSLLPGHDAHATRHHTKHGIAMIALAAVSLIGAWFTTSPGAERPPAA